ncbi:MAG TPA: type II toxin-antitoxin system VapC family toxin [Woeseiaceae bacterium]|nr:type II toxin-antitoxin system VapC family toxin [Woeseiaceae bacterium]
MILPDVNLLVYAIDETSTFHRQSRDWWQALLSSAEPVALCYPSIMGFVRLTTNRRVFEFPLTVDAALAQVQSWLDQPNTSLVVPSARHWPLLKKLLASGGVGANLTTDAHLAALAIEHGCTLYSNDRDFERFAGLRWENPLDH